MHQLITVTGGHVMLPGVLKYRLHRAKCFKILKVMCLTVAAITCNHCGGFQTFQTYPNTAKGEPTSQGFLFLYSYNSINT